MGKLKGIIEGKMPLLVVILVAIQPPLDVLSYFLGLRGSNAFSTLLRFGMLAAVALLGFFLSDAKKVYLAFYGVIAGFWVAHVANCYRIGYISVVQDTGNLLRMVNFPIFALTFITILRTAPSLRRYFALGTAIAFGEIILFTALPWLMGHGVYTYESIRVGVLGWFATPSAQSAIIVLTAPLLIYWAYQAGKYPLYLLGAVLAVGLMFVTGTKLNFYSIFIICGAYIFLFLVQLKKQSLKYVLPLLVLLALTVVFRGQSPMAERARLTDYSQDIYGSMLEESLENSGASDEVRGMIRNDGKLDEKIEIIPPKEKQVALMRRALMGIYADDGVYGFMTKNLNARFGAYNVMQAYHHTDLSSVLSDTRERKLNFARLVWQEKDVLTHFLGFEYSDFLYGDAIYDLENDFPAVFYNTGYIGFALYLAFFGVFVFVVLRALGGELQSGLQAAAAEGGKAGPLRWLKGLWLGLCRFLTIEMGAMGISFLLAVLAAQISGNVLRRPNVTIYFALSAACLFSLTASRPGPVLQRKGVSGR